VSEIQATMPTHRFSSPDGREFPAVTRSLMREIDRIAVEETGPSLLQMMENAGRSLAGLVLAHLTGAPDEGSVVVVAGPGGNGGGGICCARHLVSRVGQVHLVLVEPDRLSPAATHQLSVYQATGQGVRSLEGLGTLQADPSRQVLVDAVLGYSLRGAPLGRAAEAIAGIGQTDGPVVSLDLPSGVDADTGETPGLFVTADATLTLHLPKPGLRNPAAGDLWLADLGIPAQVTRRVGIKAPAFGRDWVLEIRRR
jgi:NAD(P)H-hydrate epimerase